MRKSLLVLTPHVPGRNLPPLGADGAAAEARHRRDGGEARAVGLVVAAMVVCKSTGGGGVLLLEPHLIKGERSASTGV